ncbi:MAG: hypothetical protein ABIE55_03670 [Candidatus Aenigmatarchaeota archaeon]
MVSERRIEDMSREELIQKLKETENLGVKMTRPNDDSRIQMKLSEDRFVAELMDLGLSEKLATRRYKEFLRLGGLSNFVVLKNGSVTTKRISRY